jgi:hypothetical protein
MRTALRRHPEDPDRALILANQHAASMFDPGPTSDQQQSCTDNARRMARVADAHAILNRSATQIPDTFRTLAPSMATGDCL